MTQAELGAELNEATTQNLLAALENVPTSNNLFVPSKNLSSVLNYLTPFLALKKSGHFEKVLWLDALVDSDDIDAIVETYSLIILIRAHAEDLRLLVKLWNTVKHNTRITVIVKDLTLSFHYEILSHMLKTKASLLEKILTLDENATTYKISNQCQLTNWETYPVCIHDFVFSLDMEDGGLLLYFHNPLDQISQLSAAVVKVMKYTTSQRTIFKLKNAFAKGDHSSLLLNNLLDDKITEMLSQLLTETEQSFYQNKLRGNTDLVVLERNLDYYPLLLSQTNYMGFLDDVVGTKDEYNNELQDNVKLVDETYDALKHINVSSIELVLRDLARKLIADENQLKEKNYGKTQAADLKAYANEAKLLASKKEEVEKHLDLVRDTFGKIDSNREGNEQYDIKKEWLALQNELFDDDYKHRLASIYSILNKYTSFRIVATLIVLVSLTSDGLYQSDYEKLELEVALNFGLAAALTLRKLNEYKLIRTTESNSFLGNFTFGRTETTTTTTTAGVTATLGEANDERSYDDKTLLGLTGGQDVYKSTYTLISKFWNLHPFDENQGAVKAVADYAVPNFALASNTVPLTNRIVESLYFRDFLTYTPVNSVHRRPNWEKLNLDTMLKGQMIDKNICDELDDRKSAGASSGYKEYVIIVLIGGISRAEISVFQHLQSKLKNKALLVFTSGLVNNEKLLHAISEA